LRWRNQPCAERLGLGGLSDEEWLTYFARFEPLPDNLASPLALAYHGHQFGIYNPAIGDGRGFLYAQLRDRDGRLIDLGTKGSGRTPYSRDGDGRLTLKGAVREVLAAQMLAALGVPTSACLSVVETGESLHRGDEPSPTRAAVLVRASWSHVRFGTFQRLAARNDAENLQRLVDYVIEVYHPDLTAVPVAGRVAALYRRIAQRSAELVGAWMAAGFVHGVLNTDNLNVTGESFDYGPYRFVPTYDLDFVAAYFDHQARYAYGRQQEAVLWALMRLGEALAPLQPFESLRQGLLDFEVRCLRAWHLGALRRLGLGSNGVVDDSILISRAMCFLGESQLGLDRFYFDWYGGSLGRAMKSPVAERYRGGKFDAFRAALAAYVPAHPDRVESTYFERDRPVSLLIDEIEALWAPIAAVDNWSALTHKLSQLGQLADLYEP